MGSSFYGGNKNSFYGGSGFYGGGDFKPELTVIDKVPYVFRKTGGDINVKKKTKQETIVGGTVAWNQICSNGNFTTTSVWNKNRCALTVADNIGTFSCNDVSYRTFSAYQNRQALKGHVYMMTAQLQCDTTNAVTSLQVAANEQIRVGQVDDPENGVWYSLGIMVKPAADIAKNFQIVITYMNASDVTIGDKLLAKNVNIFDLTQMFGTTIANYVYSLEQANTGDGVAWFRKLFPNDYYAYDAGTLRSVQTLSHKTVGFNAYDNATGTARLLGGMEYQITGAYTTLSYSTGEMITPDTNGNFTPGTNGALTVTGGDATTTCVHLVQDGKRDGKFEAYVEHSYPLDDSLTLRGVPTLDANNKFCYDGDTYVSDGTVTRRYGIVDLGSLVWYSSSVEGRYTASVNGKKPGLNNFIQAKYSVGSTYAAENDKVISGNDSRSTFSIKDTSAATAEELKTSLSGVYLVYELETPTAESADPYTNPQIIDPYGTEEFVDAGVEAGTRDVAIPVGHETTYKVKGN